MSTTREALIKRLEEASEGSRELNNLIAPVAGWHRVEPRHAGNKHGAWIAPEDWLGRDSDGKPRLDSLHGTTMHREAPDFTRSLDAAMSLVRSALPGWWMRKLAEHSDGWYCTLLYAPDQSSSEQRKTAALAVTTAALRALSPSKVTT